MADFTAADVKRLRDATGAGMMDAKKALEENGGDFDKAAQSLREKGLGKAKERSDRENTEGAVGTFLDRDKGVAALVELKSETDFVAKNPDFVNLANDLAALVAENGDDRSPAPLIESTTSRSTSARTSPSAHVVRVEAGSGQALDLYEHLQDGRVKNGVIVLLDGGTVEQAHDVAVHIAFARPKYLTRDEVPASEVEHERATYEAIASNEGKPDAALEKIVTGRLNGYFKDVALLDQPYVKDDKKTIAQYVSPATVVRFAQVEIKGK